MKTTTIRLICLSFAFSMTVSCSNRSTENQDSSDIRYDTIKDGLPDEDTVMNFRDGVNVTENREFLDTMQLPKPILDAIANDTTFKGAEILEKFRKVDKGDTIFEVVFFPVNGKEEKVTFTAEGKRRPNL